MKEETCSHPWHKARLEIRSPRCPACQAVHPWGIIIEGEYLKMLRGEPYRVTYPDHTEIRSGEKIEGMPEPIKVETRTVIDCPYAQSDMTPCVARDGQICVADDGKCVGCNRYPADMLRIW